ncbi:hypothetical protein AeNC1_010308 [Aphanomyces euteiches]|nr:hypothetical protein AeNC1_010308 [Aphanomyces euteiches]
MKTEELKEEVIDDHESAMEDTDGLLSNPPQRQKRQFALVAVAAALVASGLIAALFLRQDDTCSLDKHGFHGTVEKTPFYFARGPSQPSIPLSVFIAPSDSHNALLPCVQGSSTPFSANPNALNRHANALFVDSTKDISHTFLTSVLRAAQIDAKRQIVLMGSDLTLPDKALAILSDNFQPHKAFFLNIAGLVLHSLPCSSSNPPSSALGTLLDAGVQVVIASDSSCNASTQLDWASSIPWYGVQAFASLTTANDTCLSSNESTPCSSGTLRHQNQLAVVHANTQVDVASLGQMVLSSF